MYARRRVRPANASPGSHNTRGLRRVTPQAYVAVGPEPGRYERVPSNSTVTWSLTFSAPIIVENGLTPKSDWLSVVLPLILSPLTLIGIVTSELLPAIERSPLASLSVTSLEVNVICDEPRTLPSIVFLMSFLSLSPSGLAPPSPDSTSTELGSAVS